MLHDMLTCFAHFKHNMGIMYVPQANLSIIFNLFLCFGEYETYYLNDFMKNN